MPKLLSYKRQSSTTLYNFLFDYRSNFTFLKVIKSFKRIVYTTSYFNSISKRA